jgi:hypothetical protein
MSKSIPSDGSASSIERQLLLSLFVAVHQKLRLIETITGFAIEPVYKDASGKSVYVDEIGIGAMQICAVSCNIARGAYEMREVMLRDTLKRAYDCTDELLIAYIDEVLGPDCGPAVDANADLQDAGRGDGS